MKGGISASAPEVFTNHPRAARPALALYPSFWIIKRDWSPFPVLTRVHNLVQGLLCLRQGNIPRDKFPQVWMTKVYPRGFVYVTHCFLLLIYDGSGLVPKSCLTLCDPMDCSPPDSSVRGDSPGKNTGEVCHSLLQGIFPIQGLNPGLLHCRQILYQQSYQGSSYNLINKMLSY